MPSGRRYLVLRIGGKAILHFLVLPADEPASDSVIDWFWTPRLKNAGFCVDEAV